MASRDEQTLRSFFFLSLRVFNYILGDVGANSRVERGYTHDWLSDDIASCRGSKEDWFELYHFPGKYTRYVKTKKNEQE